jgi:hypothetical protein
VFIYGYVKSGRILKRPQLSVLYDLRIWRPLYIRGGFCKRFTALEIDPFTMWRTELEIAQLLQCPPYPLGYVRIAL